MFSNINVINFHIKYNDIINGTDLFFTLFYIVTPVNHLIPEIPPILAIPAIPPILAIPLISPIHVIHQNPIIAVFNPTYPCNPSNSFNPHNPCNSSNPWNPSNQIKSKKPYVEDRHQLINKLTHIYIHL